jgi:hypothetical protein
MRKKTPAGPVRILSAEQRAEVERQMRAQGRLRTANETELEKFRIARRERLRAENAALASRAPGGIHVDVVGRVPLDHRHKLRRNSRRKEKAPPKRGK